MRTFGVHKEILIAVDAHAVENLLNGALSAVCSNC